MNKKKILVLFFGDIRFDSRCLKIIRTLQKSNYDISVLHTPPFYQENGNLEVPINDINIIPIYFKKRKKKQPFLKYYLKSFIKLLPHRFDIYFSGELYSLPIAYLTSRFRKSEIIYDSRELFTSIAALKSKKFKQWIWSSIESFLIKKVKRVFTVNESIAGIIKEQYKILKPAILYNVPNYKSNRKIKDLHKLFNIPIDQKIINYQGGLQYGRGILFMLDIINSLEGFSLVFLGQGILEDSIKKHPQFNKKVFLETKIPSDELIQYTSSAWLGICLIENFGKSYYLSLPNKLFEYCHAFVPVVCSNFPEMKRIIDKYGIGISASSDDKKGLINAINALSNDKERYNKYKINCEAAAKELNWEIQEQILLDNI